MKDITITFDDGYKNSIIQSGFGPSIIILHGWTSSSQDWTAHIEKLSTDYTCYTWNARCTNQKNTTIHRLANDIEYIIQTLSIEKPVIIGHSMGSLTAFEYIQIYGCSSLSGLVIIDQSPKIITDASWNLGLFHSYTEQDNKNFCDSLQNNFVESVISLILNGKNMTPEEEIFLKNTAFFKERVRYLHTLEPQPWIDIWKNFTQKDYRKIIPQIDIPTLLVYGKRSKFYGEIVGSYMHENIKKSQLSVYPHSGHSPQIEEEKRFIEEVKQFIQGL